MNANLPFLRRMWGWGAAGNYDALSVHMYNIKPTLSRWNTAGVRATWDFGRLLKCGAR